MKIAIIGDGYIGQAFKDVGTIIPAKLLDISFDQLHSYDVIINTHEIQDTSTYTYDYIWWQNADLVKQLSVECEYSGKKFVQISTADLYGNYTKWANDIETSTHLDVGTDYRFTKLAAEKFCNPNDLILRIRNPFDNRVHPDNAIIKGYKAPRMYAWADTWSYLPDVVNATLKLLERQESGIWNIVNFECSSLFYCLKTAIGVPFFKSIDPIKEDMPNFLLKEMDNERIHNDVNGSKIKQIYEMTPLDAAMIISWQKGVKEDFEQYFNERKFLQKLEGVVE